MAEDNAFLARDLIESVNADDRFKLKHVSSNGEEVLQNLELDSMVDLILMDIEMPKLNGIEATRKLKSLYPQIKVIMLTVFDDDQNIFDAIRAGANGYMLKDEPFDKIADGMFEVLNGGAPMTGSIALKTLKLLQSAEVEMSSIEDYKLSKREVDVLEQLCQGLTYQEIAQNLNISAGTVRKHIENIYSKLNVHSKLEAVQLAQKQRLV
ncbi:MAG: LuxR C-terminal-related transcriptional regulator [Bacteroidia bacterium]